MTDTVKIYRDPEDETIFERHAIVWAILEESEDYYVLQVSFLSDPKAPGRKFTRKYRKREATTGERSS